MELITRAAARERGLKRYFTSKPCKHGHISQRLVSDGSCCECTRISLARRYAADPERARTRAAAWGAANKERVRAKNLEWRAKNPNYQGPYLREKRANHPVRAIRHRASVLISKAIINAGYSKRSRAHEILGCDWSTFARHLELQFLPGMTWENRHLWHIDHIVPLASAETEAEVLSLNHFTNLRPIWAADNLAKSDKPLFLI